MTPSTCIHPSEYLTSPVPEHDRAGVIVGATGDCSVCLTKHVTVFFREQLGHKGRKNGRDMREAAGGGLRDRAHGGATSVEVMPHNTDSNRTTSSNHRTDS